MALRYSQQWLEDLAQSAAAVVIIPVALGIRDTVMSKFAAQLITYWLSHIIPIPQLLLSISIQGCLLQRSPSVGTFFRSLLNILSGNGPLNVEVDNALVGTGYLSSYGITSLLVYKIGAIRSFLGAALSVSATLSAFLLPGIIWWYFSVDNPTVTLFTELSPAFNWVGNVILSIAQFFTRLGVRGYFFLINLGSQTGFFFDV